MKMEGSNPAELFKKETKMSDQIQASHILLMYEGSLRSTATRSQDEAKQKLKKLKPRLMEVATLQKPRVLIPIAHHLRKVETLVVSVRV